MAPICGQTLPPACQHTSHMLLVGVALCCGGFRCQSCVVVRVWVRFLSCLCYMLGGQQPWDVCNYECWKLRSVIVLQFNCDSTAIRQRSVCVLRFRPWPWAQQLPTPPVVADQTSHPTCTQQGRDLELCCCSCSRFSYLSWDAVLLPHQADFSNSTSIAC
jgi:hypothetical protein